MPNRRRKLTAERSEKRRRSEQFETIVVYGKMKRVRRPPTIEGMEMEEFIRRNADSIWLHQNEMWEYLEERHWDDGFQDSPMRQITNAQKRHLRDLAAKAYDRGLRAALKDLHKHFASWQAGEIAAWDLNELIHEHHNGISRELYKLYTGRNPEVCVVRAITKDFIRWDEVKDDCRPLLKGILELSGNQNPDSMSEG
ncbi:MAG TPA: hypothetical protein VFV34_27000 [Blastocatellia bacterium]|nr:hypothetical protein [Blastocatellia bacterium]